MMEQTAYLRQDGYNLKLEVYENGVRKRFESAGGDVGFIYSG